MRILHIVPKTEFSLPIAENKYLLVQEICAEEKGRHWHVRTRTDWNVEDAAALKQAVVSQLSLPGEVTVENRVEFLHHGGDMPLSQTDADLNAIANVDCQDMEGYDIPHEDIYDQEEPDDSLRNDPAYIKACMAVANEAKGGSSGSTKASRSAGSTTKDSRVWLGKYVKGEVTPINDVIGEERPDVLFQGDVVKVEFRETKTKRIIVNFQLADKTNGISAQKFLDVAKGNSKFRRRNTITQEELDALQANLKVGASVKVHGDVKYSDYLNDYVLNVDSIMPAANTTTERVDTNPTPRVELHLHTVMSDMDALITVKDLIKTVKKWHHPAVAVTDHGVVQSFPLLQDVSTNKTNNVKVIYGMEGYLFDTKIDESYHIVILAKNQIGVRNLYKLVSISHLKYIYRGRPRIPRAVLNEYREGLILGSACEAGELVRSMVQKNLPYEELKKIASYYDYLEIQPITNNEFLVREGLVSDDEGLRDINRKILRIGDELGKKTVATCDAHFMNPEDKIYREILMTGKGFKDAQHQPDL